MNSLFSRALLAALPTLGLVLATRDGVLYGGILFGIFLLTIFVLRFIHRITPAPVHRISFFLLIAVLGVKTIPLLFPSGGPLSFLPLASLWLLAPTELFRKRGNWRRIRQTSFLTSLFFWVLLAGHGFLSEVLGHWAGVHLFQHPAGSYLLAALALTFFPQGVRR